MEEVARGMTKKSVFEAANHNKNVYAEISQSYVTNKTSGIEHVFTTPQSATNPPCLEHSNSGSTAVSGERLSVEARQISCLLLAYFQPTFYTMLHRGNPV